MQSTTSNAEESTDLPNQDARTVRTCEVCGRESDKVDRLTDMDGLLPRPVDCCTACSPTVKDDLREWFEQEVLGDD